MPHTPKPETIEGQTAKAVDPATSCSLSFADFSLIWNDAGNPTFAASPELSAFLRSLPSDPRELRDYLTANEPALPEDGRNPTPTP